MNTLKGSIFFAVVTGFYLFFGTGIVPVFAEIVNGIEGAYPDFEVVEEPGTIEETNEVSEVGNSATINFDDVTAPCLFMEANALKGTFNGANFKGKGSNGGAILDECSNFTISGYSSPNFLAFNCTATLKSGGKPSLPESITFLSPSTGDVTLKVGASSGGKVKITAVRTNGTNVKKTVTLHSAMQTVTLTGPHIKKIKIQAVKKTCILLVDDITF
ncbi:MAG: hypothetical protein HZB37_05045 [Planctomycetes bacterium]|nr:hypothetical protein [Planctomycetota bacterium]